MNAVTKGTSPDKNKDEFLAQPGIQDKVNLIAKKLNISVDELLYAFGKETAGSYSSAQRNLGDGKAVGLIQFYPDKGKSYKTINGKRYEISDLEQMSELEQLDVVETYLTKNFKDKGGKAGELYVSIAYPALVGKTDDTKIDSKRLASVAAQNPGWVDENGNITKSSISGFGSKPEFSQYTTPTENEKSSDVPTAEEAASRQDYTQGTSKRVFEAQSFLQQYAKIENSQLGEADKIARIAELYRTSPGAKYAIPNYVQGVARTPVGNTGMQDIDIEKLQEGYVDADADYLLGINEERGSRSLKSLVTKLRRDLNSQGSEEILNRAYKTDQMFSGVPASKLFEYIPEYSNQEGADMSLEPSALDPAIIAKQTPIVLDERLLQQKPITLKTIRPGQTDTDGVTILTREPVGEGLDEEDEEVYPELTKEQQKQVNKITKQKSKTKFGKLFNINNEGLKNTLNTIKNSADEAFFALSAGAGIMSVYEATRRDKVTKSHVDPLFKEALLKTREAAQVGMPYEQRQAALKDIANSYSGAMKNVMAISGGQRGAALANIGAVDSSRVNALVDLASKSADMRQKNLDLYSKTAAAYSNQKLNADMTHEQLKQKVEMNRKNNLRAIGLNLFKEATEFSRNYMDISGIEGSGNQTSIISANNTGSGVVDDELSDNLGIG